MNTSPLQPPPAERDNPHDEAGLPTAIHSCTCKIITQCMMYRTVGKVRMVQIFVLFADGLATAKIRTAKV